MIPKQIIVVVIASLIAADCVAIEPAQFDVEMFYKLNGGQWMINEDRHRLVETREEDNNSVRSRSWLLDNSFKRIIRNDTYRYDAVVNKLSATIVWSNGSNWECEGVWDTETKTLIFLAPVHSGTRSFALCLIASKIVEYKIVDRDKTGKVEWEYTEKRYRLAD